MKVEWSAAAIADLDRFAIFLQEQHPRLAIVVAGEIVKKVQILAAHPKLGRAIAGHQDYREVVLQVLNAAYVFQYRHDGERIVMLRVFHGREARE